MPKPPLPSVDEHLASLPADRRDTILTLHQAIRRAVPKLAPLMMSGMGPAPLLAYGKYHYRYASGREGDWFLIGLAAAKTGYSLHICAADKEGYLVERHAASLGKVKAGRSCISFKRLEDLELKAVIALIKRAAKVGGLGAVAATAPGRKAARG
jgi:hypothetical protein